MIMWFICHKIFFVNISLLFIYCGEHKDQNGVKKKSKCEIAFYFKTSLNIFSGKNKDIQGNYIILKYEVQ